MTTRPLGAIFLWVLLLVQLAPTIPATRGSSDKIRVNVTWWNTGGHVDLPSGFTEFRPFYDGDFDEGTTITLVAVPDPGWVFFHWYDGATSKEISRNSTLTFRVSRNCTIAYVGNMGDHYEIMIRAEFIEMTGMAWGFDVFVTTMNEPGRYYRTDTLVAPIGTEARYNLTVLYWFGMAQPVSIVFEGVPVGISISISPNPITPNGSGVLSLSASNSTREGEYSMRINATRLGEGQNLKTLSEDYKLFVARPKVVTGWRQVVIVSPYARESIPASSGLYPEGEELMVSLEKTIVDQGNGTRRVFTGWTSSTSLPLNMSSPTIVFTVDSNITLVANWKTQYRLTLVIEPLGGGVVDFSEWNDFKSEVTIRASPSLEYEFDSWSGSITGIEPVATLRVDSPKTVVARFVSRVVQTFSWLPIAGVVMFVSVAGIVLWLLIRRRSKSGPA
jgi:hypothetical protein